jgi:hypothetical protein
LFCIINFILIDFSGQGRQSALPSLLRYDGQLIIYYLLFITW